MARTYKHGTYPFMHAPNPIRPEKTESLGVAIVAVIFASDDDDDSRLGLLTLPIIVYHTIQLIVAAAAVGRIRGMIEREEEEGRVLRVKSDDVESFGQGAPTQRLLVNASP